MTTKNDEIDLLELFAKAILIAKKNFVLILSLFLVGLLLGIGFNQFAPKKYGSNMLVSSEILTESYCKEVIETLNDIIRDHNPKLLAERLRIPIEAAEKVIELKVKSAIEKPDGVQEKDKIYLRISVDVTDNSALPQLETGLITYFENNPFIKIRVENKRQLYTKLIERISKEIEDLEKVKENSLKGSSKNEGSLTLDPSAINETIVDLTKLLLENENQLKIVNSVQIIEGFTAYADPVSPRLALSTAGGISLGLFFALTVIAFKGIRSMVRFSEQKLGQS